MASAAGAIEPLANPWSTACLDWERRLMAGESLVPRLPLFEAEAARALRIFRRLRIPDVIGTPTMAEACGPWFFPIVAAVCGSYDPELNVRMLQEFFLLIPKGNSKTSYGGPLMLVAVIMNRRPEAGFSFIAPTIEIAGRAFNQAEGTIRLDPELDKLFHVQRHLRTITNRVTGASLKIKAADTDVVTGGKDVGTMIDETHVFAEKADAEAIFVELRGALSKRKDGFLFQTTTQSKKPPAGVFKRELERARAVRDGKRALPLLPVMYEYPDSLVEGRRWMEDQASWGLVNPNLGRSVDEAYLARELAEAEEAGTDKLMLVASQHWNIQIGIGLHGDRWRGADYWEGAGEPGLADLETFLARCEVVVAGIDGGGLDDLYGLCLAGREKGTGRWIYWFRAWVWADVLSLRKEIAPRLLDFAAAGDLVICGGRPSGSEGSADSSDNNEEEAPPAVEEDISGIVAVLERVRDWRLFPARGAIGVDAQGIGGLVDALEAIGFQAGPPSYQIVPVSQGFRLSSAVWSMERKLKHGMLAHSGSAMMAWCVGNAKAEQRGNAVLITKQAAGKAKIDPLVAGFNATKLLEANPEAAGALDVTAMVA